MSSHYNMLAWLAPLNKAFATFVSFLIHGPSTDVHFWSCLLLLFPASVTDSKVR